MEKTQTPDIRKIAKQLDRLYRERDNYLVQAADFKTEAIAKRQAGASPEEYNGLIDRYSQAVAWSADLQPQIDNLTGELQAALGSLNW